VTVPRSWSTSSTERTRSSFVMGAPHVADGDGARFAAPDAADRIGVGVGVPDAADGHGTAAAQDASCGQRLPSLRRTVHRMTYRPRAISFLDREGRVKHYGISVDQPTPHPRLATAVRRVAGEVIPDGAAGFTIAHDAATAGLGLVYWWANDNEIHARFFASPHDDPDALEPADGTGLACVWELEVIDFERRAWLEDVLKRDDEQGYLERTLEATEL
jgi:hypothetical protein